MYSLGIYIDCIGVEVRVGGKMNLAPYPQLNMRLVAHEAGFVHLLAYVSG